MISKLLKFPKPSRTILFVALTVKVWTFDIAGPPALPPPIEIYPPGVQGKISCVDSWHVCVVAVVPVADTQVVVPVFPV